MSPGLIIPVIGALLLLSSGGGDAYAGDVTIAFVGDQGSGQGARDVLSLIAANDVDLLVSGGDLGYDEGPEAWIANMDGILGADFPVLAVVGNHEGEDWPEYRRWLEARVNTVDDLACRGEIGVKAHCTFRGISVVQTAPGIHEVPGVLEDDDYAGYLARELADNPNAWRICSWHKLQKEMQVGGKNTDSAGWGVYEACREGGGIVATAHEHSYSRTHLLSDFSEQRIVHKNDHLEIAPGQTFAFVSGLGGKTPRPQLRGGDWWASIYTATQGATHGALFCTFGERTAECRFEDVAGGVPDRFTLEWRSGSPETSDGTASEALVVASTEETSEGGEESEATASDTVTEPERAESAIGSEEDVAVSTEPVEATTAEPAERVPAVEGEDAAPGSVESAPGPFAAPRPSASEEPEPAPSDSSTTDPMPEIDEVAVDVPSGVPSVSLDDPAPESAVGATSAEPLERGGAGGAFGILVSLAGILWCRRRSLSPGIFGADRHSG